MAARFLAVFTLLTVTGCASGKPYSETRTGKYFYMNPFAYKPANSEEHWKYAESLKEKGDKKSARKQYEIFAKRWPESAEAPAAKQAVAELYSEAGKNKKAFNAYEELITQYYSSVKDYDSIMEKQFTLAETEMNRKRMRWLFGGYLAPERSVPLFESIIRNAPQWERAPESQYMIGQAYQKNDDQELAVVAYSTVEYRYPNSPFAEKAAVAKLGSYKELVDSTPYSIDIREQAELSAGLFPELYTNSQHIAGAKDFGVELHGLDAKHFYETGEFYERVPRPVQTNSAVIYYNKVIKEFGDTEYAAKAAARLRVLFPHGEAIAADGTLAPILPVVADVAGESGGGGGSGVAAAVGSGKGIEGFVRVERTPLPERIAEDEEAVEVSADRMEYQGDLLIAEGNVSVQQKGASLQADKVTVNHKTGEINAAGNILMLREGASWEGRELVYNYKTRQGNFSESFMHFEPAYITAERSERVATNEFVMYNVMMTTCEGDSPAIYAKAKEARVFNSGLPGDPYIKAKNVTFYIGPVPIFYTPVWNRHLGYRVFTFYFGHGSQVGAFAKVRAELHPTDWMIANSHFDMYADRGIGIGQRFNWRTPNGKGAFKAYHIDDSDPTSSDDPPSERAITDSSRYRVRLEQQEQLTEDTYFMTRLNYLSDPGVVEDFIREEYLQEANPENFAVVQKATDTYGASVRVDHRLNDFYTTVERLPVVSYDKYRTQLGDSPFYYESENTVGAYEFLNADMPGLTNGPDYNAGRFDTYNRLFLPLKFKDFYNVIPRAGYRGTWYSDTPEGDAEYRNIYELGTLTSFKTYKHLTTKSSYFGDGLRHVAEPYADYSYRPEPNLRPSELYQFDEVDTFDEQNEVRFGQRNLLQTKRGLKRIANFLDSDVYTTYRFDPGTNNLFGPLVANAEMSITDNFFIQTDTEYDWYTHELSPYNFRLEYVSDDMSAYSFGYRYLEDERSLISSSVRLFPNSKWSYELGCRYDTMENGWEDRRIVVNHKFNCIGMGVGYSNNEYDGNTFWVQFWLTAFPQGPMQF